ncbi:unnamed protein product, partial [Discosporangium mesarthrocarpum]
MEPQKTREEEHPGEVEDLGEPEELEEAPCGSTACEENRIPPLHPTGGQKQEDRSAAPPVTYGERLWERLDIVKDKGTHGVKTCKAMSIFLDERATLDKSYGKALVKAVEKFQDLQQHQVGGVWGQAVIETPTWAPVFVEEGWLGLLAAVKSWGKQHVGWALCIMHNISKTLSEYAERHQGHVERLWMEAQELMGELEVVQGDYTRAKREYEKACLEASRVLTARDKAREAQAAAEVAAEAAAMAEAQAAGAVLDPEGGPNRSWKGLKGGEGQTMNLAEEQGGHTAAEGPEMMGVHVKAKMAAANMFMRSSVTKMLEKVGENITLAVSMAGGELPLAELEEKVPQVLEKVDVSEMEYIAAILALNGYNAEFQTEMEAKLNQFQ